MTISILSGLAGIVALGFTIFSASPKSQQSSEEARPSINTTNGNVQVGNNNSVTNNTTINQENSGVPSIPPDISAPIFTARELFSQELGPASGCFPEGSTQVMTLAKAGQDDLYSGEILPNGKRAAAHFFVVNEMGVQIRIYLDSNIDNVTASWIPAIMVPGRQLKVEYAQCGNGAIKIFTYIEALKAVPQ